MPALWQPTTIAFMAVAEVEVGHTPEKEKEMRYIEEKCERFTIC